MAPHSKVPTYSALNWSSAETLRGHFKQPEYGRIILLFIMLRWLDCLLADMKDAGLEAVVALPEDTDDEYQDIVLGGAAGHGLTLSNTSDLTFATLRGRGLRQIHQNRTAHLTAFRDFFFIKFLEQMERFHAAAWKPKYQYTLLLNREIIDADHR